MTGRFVIHEHHARNLHWDLRLEFGAVLRSWAVPKNIAVAKGVKRLAIAVEDHPLDYLCFEGEIPQGHYGAGTVRIWDSGTYTLFSLSKKSIELAFHGTKVSGSYVLLHLRDAQWLIFRR